MWPVRSRTGMSSQEWSGRKPVAHSTVVISPLVRSSSRGVRGSMYVGAKRCGGGRRERIVEPRRGGPLIGPVQEPVHLQVGEGARVAEGAGELGHAVSDAAE